MEATEVLVVRLSTSKGGNDRSFRPRVTRVRIGEDELLVDGEDSPLSVQFSPMRLDGARVWKVRVGGRWPFELDPDLGLSEADVEVELVDREGQIGAVGSDYTIVASRPARFAFTQERAPRSNDETDPSEADLPGILFQLKLPIAEGIVVRWNGESSPREEGYEPAVRALHIPLSGGGVRVEVEEDDVQERIHRERSLGDGVYRVSFSDSFRLTVGDHPRFEELAACTADDCEVELDFLDATGSSAPTSKFEVLQHAKPKLRIVASRLGVRANFVVGLLGLEPLEIAWRRADARLKRPATVLRQRANQSGPMRHDERFELHLTRVRVPLADGTVRTFELEAGEARGFPSDGIPQPDGARVHKVGFEFDRRLQPGDEAYDALRFAPEGPFEYDFVVVADDGESAVLGRDYEVVAQPAGRLRVSGRLG
jgi:hypothetical protein